MITSTAKKACRLGESVNRPAFAGQALIGPGRNQHPSEHTPVTPAGRGAPSLPSSTGWLSYSCIRGKFMEMHRKRGKIPSKKLSKKSKKMHFESIPLPSEGFASRPENFDSSLLHLNRRLQATDVAVCIVPDCDMQNVVARLQRKLKTSRNSRS